MTRYILPNKNVVQGDTPFVLNDVQYTGADMLLQTERDALGLKAVVEQPYPTGDFQFVNEDPANPGGYVVTPYPKERIVAELLALAADTRWQKEQGGLTVSGLKVSTDDRSKLLLMGASIAAASAPTTYTTPWVSSDGTVTVINAAQVAGLATAVSNFVDGCFQTFATVSAGITAGTITTKADVIAAFQ